MKSPLNPVLKLVSTSVLQSLRKNGRLLSTLPAFEHLIVEEPKKHVAHVQLNRPDQLNAFNLQMWREVGAVFNRLAEDSECRSIVFSGNGRCFSAGLDLKGGMTEIAATFMDESLDVARKARKLRNLVQEFQAHFSALEKCIKPVIACAHGFCYGAGINVLASCDIRYCSDDVKFSIREAKLGLAADVGILNRINKLVGNDSLTRELTYTARDFYAAEALEYGIVSRVFSTHEASLRAGLTLAETIAQRSPIAVQGAKLALNYARDHTVDDSLNFILTWNQSQLQTEDLMKSAAATMSKSAESLEFDNV